MQGSVVKAADVERIFAETKKAFGKVDVLVNNAGVYEFKPIEEVTEEHYNQIFDTNVKGLLLATKEAVKHFNGDGASIINIGSAVTEVHRLRASASIREQKALWIPSLAFWPRSWVRGRFA